MSKIIKRYSKRAIVAMVSVILIITLISPKVFAWTSEIGKSCISTFGDYYVGYDGDYYRSKSPMKFLFYNNDGTTFVKTKSFNNAHLKYLLKDGHGTHQVYCVEAGVQYNDNHNYISNSGSNSKYFKNLPLAAQHGIMVTLMYGWHEGMKSPVSGTNADDYAFATQTIIWEYQQQLRVDPTTTKSANGINADTYYYSIKGRPAEKCYNWILKRMAQHYTVPSFASRNMAKAEIHTLKYNKSSENYSLTLEDKNNVLADFQILSKDITVKRNGNKYTFTSDKMMKNAVTVTAKKNIAQNCKDMLIWGCIGQQTMVSGASDPVNFFIKFNTETTGVGHIIKQSEDGNIGGIKFNISGNGVNETVTTNSDGTADIELMPGEYTVTEITDSKYEPQSIQQITIVSGDTTTVTFNNILKRGDVQIIKSCEDNFNEGVKFHLFGTSLSGVEVDEYAVTDKKGVATFKDILISGDTPYTVEEVDTAVRYVIPKNQTASVVWDEVTSRSFTNVLKKFSVTLIKKDSEKGLPQGNATLAGAKYGIYKNNQLIDIYYTDEKGQFTTKEYICDDDWTICEIEPSEGYLLDTKIHSVGAEPQKYTIEHNLISMDVKEDIVKGKISIIKHSDNGDTKLETPEIGATFEVYLKSSGNYINAKDYEKDIITCDEYGFAQTKPLPYGIYVVHQTSGFEGCKLLDDFEVFISQNDKTYRYLANNRKFESYIHIIKEDAETGKVIPYSGAGFQIYDDNNNLITMSYTYPNLTTADTFYTDSTGKLITPEKLAYGSYHLVEVQAPYGYILDNTPIQFDVSEENSVNEGGITLTKVVKSDFAQKGTINIYKYGDVFSGVNVFGGTDSDGNELPLIYQPIYENTVLDGAKYKIVAAEDIVTPDGTLRYSKGTVVDIVTTNRNGLAKSKELYLGKYDVIEIKAPYGTVLNDEAHTVSLVYAGQFVDVTDTNTLFYNERQKVQISLKKELENNNVFNIGSNGEIKSISFGLFADETLVSQSKTSIPKDGLIEIITVDENGYGYFKSDVPLGNYYVKEIATDNHYILSDKKYPVEFLYQGEKVGVVEIIVNRDKNIVNHLKYGSVSGKKVDENGNALSGAVIGLFAKTNIEFTTENALLTTVSAQDGSFYFKDVPVGVWYVKEIKQPVGYILNDAIYEVVISENKQIIEFEIVNNLIRGDITLTKVDEDYPDTKLTGATFAVYHDSNDNGKYDSVDRLVGNLKETEIGVYKITDIIYGRYFVKETKAPDGFLLDNEIYEVFIDTDKKVYTVENKVGVGFTNSAEKGTLKIIKTSSDSKVDGFTFRVTGANGYDKTFKTNKDGEIIIKNIRAGEYNISEVLNEVSSAYDLPADKKAVVKADSMTIVKMHNSLISYIKTGDTRNPLLWLIVGTISATCAIVCVVANLKRKKEDNE